MFRNFTLYILWYIPGFRSFAERRLPTHKRGYRYYWTSDEGKKYRLAMYKRQSKESDTPLVDNPTVEEMRSAIDPYVPKNVLEVGCGYGRILEQLKPFYDIEGCDVSDDLLALAPQGIKTFKLDLVNPDNRWLQSHKGKWDVVFCRAVTMYFKEQPEDMRKAMRTMELLANKKVVVWEWAHVLEAMKPYKSNKFEFHIMKVWAE